MWHARQPLRKTRAEGRGAGRARVGRGRSSARSAGVGEGAAGPGSAGFSLYVGSFGSYGEPYGALAGIVVLLLWLFLTSFIILLGAEINSETEQQTARDTTKGPERPMGERDAGQADTLPPRG